jgi:hypothetical protein
MIMTKEQIETVLERVRTWPSSRQEDAVRILLAMEEQETELYRLSDEERTEIRAALEEVARGEFASDEEVAAVFQARR